MNFEWRTTIQGNKIPMLVNKVRLQKGDKLLVSKVAAGDKHAEEVKSKAAKPIAKSKAKNKDKDEPEAKKARTMKS